MTPALALSAKARRARISALAARRRLFAMRLWPRFKKAWAAALANHAREVARRAREAKTPFLPASTIARWKRELVALQNKWVPALAAHGWAMAGEEVALVARKKASGRAFRGKSAGSEVPGYDDFVRRADWPALEKWINTTAESASATTGQRMLGIYERAASHWDPDTKRGMTPREIAAALVSEGVVDGEKRAAMLAQTGAIWAYNEGAVQRYQRDGIEVCEWLVADDELACPFCASMLGVRVPVGDPFLQSGDHISLGDEGTLKVPTGKYGFDVRHPPLHPNCRCTLIPIIDELQLEEPPNEKPVEAGPLPIKTDTFERAQEAWENGLLPEERAAFEFWGAAHHLIRDLSAGKYVEDVEAQKAFLNLTHAMSKAPKAQGVFYRGTAMSEAEAIGLSEMRLGAIQSATADRAVAREFAMARAEQSGGKKAPVILIVGTKTAVDVSVLTGVHKESEYLLAKGARFAVRSIKKQRITWLGESVQGLVIRLEDAT